jgi:cytochrome bd-type quinol oxidase subunit 1
MMYVYVVLFFILIGLFVYLAIRYLEQENIEQFAEDMMKKRNREREEMMSNMYKKPRKEDITDL